MELLESDVYNNKVKINQWRDKMMEHKKIYYASELKMYQLEMMLAKWDNSGKLRWSVRNCEIPTPAHHQEREPRRAKQLKDDEEEVEVKKDEDVAASSSSSSYAYGYSGGRRSAKCNYKVVN